MHHITTPDFTYLNRLNCNTETQLQLLTPTRPIRLKTRLIGVDPNNAIILALGEDLYWQAAQEFITQGQGVVVRIINSDDPEANIIAFRGQIKTLLNNSGRWLVVTYPKELQSVALRQHSRIPVNIAATLHEQSPDTHSTHTSSNGFLQDISIKGGAYIGEELPGGEIDKRYRLQVKFTQSLETLTVPITLKNILVPRVKGERFQYGFVIEEADNNVEEFVQKVILNHLLQQPKG